MPSIGKPFENNLRRGKEVCGKNEERERVGGRERRGERREERRREERAYT